MSRCVPCAQSPPHPQVFPNAAAAELFFGRFADVPYLDELKVGHPVHRTAHGPLRTTQDRVGLVVVGGGLMGPALDVVKM